MELSLNTAKETLPIALIPLTGLLLLVAGIVAGGFLGWGWSVPFFVLGVLLFGGGMAFFGAAALLTDWKRW